MEVGYNILKTLKEGVQRLSVADREAMIRYVRSQMTADGSFLNRGRRQDLYYTMFGWMLCYVLNIKTDDAKRKNYLDSIDEEALDELHKSVFGQCRMLNDLLNKGIIVAAVRNWRHRGAIEQFFNSYVKHTMSSGLNAEAVKLLLDMPSGGGEGQSSDRILSLQDETGGFRANEGAEIPDILSTAVALFALKMKGVKPRYHARDFIEVHINDEGAFMPNLLDETSDVEYVFYGLLAMGSISQ